MGLDRQLKVTRWEICDDLSKVFPHLSEAQVIRPLVNALFARLKEYLLNGHHIHIKEFGNFVTVTHKGRPLVSNLTGHKVVLSPKRVAKFRISANFEKRLNKCG